MRRQPHDRFFKGLLAAPDVALALFRGLLPPALLAGVRPQDLSHGDGALSRPGRALYPDRLYRVRLDGKVRLRVLVEHQTRPDPDMGARLLDAALALCRQGKGDREDESDQPVVGLVVYQGRAPWVAPLSFDARFRATAAQREALGDLLPSFRYSLLDLHRVDEHTLPAHATLRLGLLMLKHAHARDPWPLLLREPAIVREVLNVGGAAALSPALGYATEIVRQPPPIGFADDLAVAAGYTLGEVFMSYANQLRQEGRREGRLEGRQEGRLMGLQEGQQEGRLVGRREGEVVGQRAMLRRLLERRFGALSSEAAARISDATLEGIVRWTDDLLTASSPQALLGLQG